MENLFLCDLFRSDYEQYLRQAILFSTKVNVMYPDINYSRDVDKAAIAEKISTLYQYAKFDNVKLVPMKGESDRHFDFEHNPIVLDTVCRELNLSEIEKNCFLEYRDQEFDYLSFNSPAPWRIFCTYMHHIFNIAIEYTDMCRLFCKTYSNYHGNVLSNSSFLRSLLDSNAVQEEKIYDMSCNENFSVRDKCFYRKHYCSQCKAEVKQITNSISLISAKEKVIEILMPDYSTLELDDLYEIQLKANSEIQQLATYIDEISLAANNEEELDRLIKSKITPSVSELQAKVKGIHLTSIQKALSIKDVAAIPILVELMPNLPAYIPIALSAAFIVADVGIEMKKEYLQLKQDPMYFTIKLNELSKRQKRRI
ncbi:MAG: hypothetical protein J1F11_09455 [Oscillospiraceae bacterium]|nr:hypothetical protein [Oscillospiraceae bacterium]